MKRDLEAIYIIVRTIIFDTDWGYGAQLDNERFSDINKARYHLQSAIDAGFVTLRPCESIDSDGRLWAMATWKGQCFVDLYEEHEKLVKDHGKSSKKAMIARLHLLGFH